MYTGAMNISLPLSPEEQAESERRGAAAGTDLSALILEALHEKLDEQNGSSGETTPYEQWHKEFRAWIADQRSRNPDFDDSGGSIYD